MRRRIVGGIIVGFSSTHFCFLEVIVDFCEYLEKHLALESTKRLAGCNEEKWYKLLSPISILEVELACYEFIKVLVILCQLDDSYC